VFCNRWQIICSQRCFCMTASHNSMDRDVQNWLAAGISGKRFSSGEEAWGFPTPFKQDINARTRLD